MFCREVCSSMQIPLTSVPPIPLITVQLIPETSVQSIPLISVQLGRQEGVSRAAIVPFFRGYLDETTKTGYRREWVHHAGQSDRDFEAMGGWF